MIIDFKIANNIIVASHITGIYDINRNTILGDDDFLLVSNWVQSITKLGLQGIIFHNNFSEKTCQLYQNDAIHFVKIDYNSQYNPNIYRYFIYSIFLNLKSHLIKNIFFTDVSDVIVLKNPFED